MLISGTIIVNETSRSFSVKLDSFVQNSQITAMHHPEQCNCFHRLRNYFKTFLFRYIRVYITVLFWFGGKLGLQLRR